MDKFSSADIGFMKTALGLAKKGLGRTFPNPMVGSVIVKHGKIIGQGYHHQAGLPHAEINALASAKSPVAGATLYVTLEPCSHHGRTPPCADAIIKAKIARVVCCSLDPNTKVNGRGARKLREAGIEVSVGILAGEAKLLNEIFFAFQQKRRPFVAIKFAASLDGKIATRFHDSRWITNEQARAFARSLRSNYPAVLVGIITVIRDNPDLGGSLPGAPDPIRIIFDSTLRIPLKSRVLRDKNVLVVTTERADQKTRNRLSRLGIPIFACPGSTISLSVVMRELARREITGVFAEGGGRTLGNLVDAGLVDKVYAFYAPILLGGKDAVSAIEGRGADKVAGALRLTRITHTNFNANYLITGYTATQR